MGKIADIIRNVIDYGIYPNELKFSAAEITDDQCQQEIKKYIEQGEKEIIELIEKVVPKQENGNVALYRIGYNDCRKDIKQNIHFLRCVEPKEE